MSRLDLIDAHGTRHRFGCDMPGWTAESSTTLPNVLVMRCSSCGALRLHNQEQT